MDDDIREVILFFYFGRTKRHVNDLWEDMDRLNALYEELMWDTDDVLEFSADYDNDQIIIRNRTREMEIEEGTRKNP